MEKWEIENAEINMKNNCCICQIYFINSIYHYCHFGNYCMKCIRKLNEKLRRWKKEDKLLDKFYGLIK